MGKYFLNRKHKEGCAGADNAYNRVPMFLKFQHKSFKDYPKPAHVESRQKSGERELHSAGWNFHPDRDTSFLSPLS